MPGSVRENGVGPAVLADCAAGRVDALIIAGVRISVVEYEVFSCYDFEPPASYYTRSAMGQYYFYHTRDRAKAQAAADELLGERLYTVTSTRAPRAAKGTLTVTGTQTRRGQRR